MTQSETTVVFEGPRPRNDVEEVHGVTNVTRNCDGSFTVKTEDGYTEIGWDWQLKGVVVDTENDFSEEVGILDQLPDTGIEVLSYEMEWEDVSFFIRCGQDVYRIKYEATDVSKCEDYTPV